jgi:hypothetical protein
MYAKGQSLDTNNIKPPEQPSNADSIKFTGPSETSPLYNGRIFYWYPAKEGHAFFLTPEWQTGSVLYDDVWYHNIKLKYDIYKDEVIVLHPSYKSIRLFSERVQEFNIGTNNFIRLKPGKNSSLREGFYHRLAEGKITVLALHEKRLKENISDNKLVQYFDPANFYYVLKDGVYHPLRKLKTLLEQANDQRQNIVRHLRKQGLKFRLAKEKTIAEAASFYNQSQK